MCSFSIRRGGGGALQFRIVFPFWWSLMKCYYTTLIHTFRQRAAVPTPIFIYIYICIYYIYILYIHVLDQSTYYILYTYNAHTHYIGRRYATLHIIYIYYVCGLVLLGRHHLHRPRVPIKIWPTSVCCVCSTKNCCRIIVYIYIPNICTYIWYLYVPIFRKIHEKYYNIILCERDEQANFLIYVILLFEHFFSRLPGDVFIVLHCV